MQQCIVEISAVNELIDYIAYTLYMHNDYSNLYIRNLCKSQKFHVIICFVNFNHCFSIRFIYVKGTKDADYFADYNLRNCWKIW